jgi:argininosuccinate lyase
VSRQVEGYLGLEGRVGSGPADALVDSGYRTEIQDAAFLHRGFGLADLAHVIELADLGIVPAEEAGRLGGELLAALDTPTSQFPYDPVYGDAYNSRERELERRVGSAAGWLPTGRTRREAGRIAFRLALRSALLDLHGAVADLATALVERAREHAETPWNDTTYLQPAQPSTFGHYLAGFAEQATRDLARVERAYDWVNCSPAGVGGVAGTSIPVDRDRLAARLGFDRPARHTRDAMWSVDGLVDAAVAAVQATTTLDRLAEDLEVFASPQFGYVTLAGSASRASVLLPQKKNPYALAVIRGGAGTLIGRATGLMATQRTPSARTDNWLYAYGETHGAVAMARSLIRLGREVTDSMIIDRERLLATAGEQFSIAADLTERIVLDLGLDYRSAYRIVGRAVADAVAADRSRLRPGDLWAAAQELDIAVPPDLDEVLKKVEDASSVACGRNVAGGSAPERVREHCDSVERDVRLAKSWAAEARARIESAETRLVTEARNRWS